jgi:hypothetical protein
LLKHNKYHPPVSILCTVSGATIPTQENSMKKLCTLFVFAVLAATLTGCGVSTIVPNYSSTNPDLMRIGGEMPSQKEPEMLNLGSYCLQVTDKWKPDGKTPDSQMIWSKDSYRKAVPCHK